eukprot:scaffold647965_cov49-Prasinocladus_malaysianus.AAC.2
MAGAIAGVALLMSGLVLFANPETINAQGSLACTPAARNGVRYFDVALDFAGQSRRVPDIFDIWTSETNQFSGAFEVYGSAFGEQDGKAVVEAGREVTAFVRLIDESAKDVTGQNELQEAEAHLDIRGPEEVSVPLSLSNSLLQASFKYTIAGSYRIRVMITNQQLGEVHVVNVVPGPPVLDENYVRVMQVTHGQTGDRLKFQVQFWDAEENIIMAEDLASQIDFTGTKVVGQFQSPRGTSSETTITYGRQLTITTETFNPMFVGTFSPIMAGDWLVYLMVNGVQIHKPTWPPMTVSPGYMDPEGCTVEGLGLAFMQRAGHEYKLAIVPGDRHGNEVVPQRPEMAYAFSASIRYMEDGVDAEEVGGDIGQRSFFHERDNAYYLEFQPTRSGTLLVEARILGVEIPSSPFK